MNIRLIIFSGIVTAAIGGVLGVAVAEIGTGERSPEAIHRYSVVGVVMGLVVGSAQETVRQLKDRSSAEQD